MGIIIGVQMNSKLPQVRAFGFLDCLPLDRCNYGMGKKMQVQLLAPPAHFAR
jgi:hypothetical protein